MKKVLVWILVIISLASLLLRFSDKIAEVFLGARQESGISVLSVPPEATVFLNEKEVGKTPYEDKNMEVGGYTVRIEKEGAFWKGKVKLTAGTVTIVNRDLATDPASSSGEILSLNKGKGLTIVSNPTESEVEIDGKSYGKTPVIANIDTGEHSILLSHINYLKRSIKADLPDGFNLTVSVDLGLSEADLTAVTTPVITQTPEVLVKQTPTDFLRVRDKPSLSGREVALVKPGDTLILLEETGAWDRVRLPDGKEGFVSSTYVEKKNP